MNAWLNMGLDILSTVAKTVNPVAGLVVSGIQAIVEKQDDGISNDSVITVLEEMGKSTWNNLTPNKIEQIQLILFSDEEV